MTTQHALAPAHAAMPKGPEGGGGGGSSDGDGGGGEDEDPTTIHITHNWRSPSMLCVADRVCVGIQSTRSRRKGQGRSDGQSRCVSLH